jgi:peptidoglycan/LPS O-acetylase OafA/YrhL
MFLLGSFLYESRRKGRIALLFTYCISLAAFFWVLRDSAFVRPYNFEVLIGILVGLPIVTFVVRLPSHPVDTTLGNISYGVFLNHFLLIWIFQALQFKLDSVEKVTGLIAMSIVLGWLSYTVVEKPILRFRRELRRAKTCVLDKDVKQEAGN